MLEFEVQRCSRKCCIAGREILPGETYYSALVSEGAEVVRRDYAAESWNGPPEHSLGWWKSKLPEADGKKIKLAPSEVMLRYFEELEDRADREDERYVLALLMIRRRVVRHDRNEPDAAGRDCLVLQSLRGEREYRAVAATPRPERIREIQDRLASLLYSQG